MRRRGRRARPPRAAPASARAARRRATPVGASAASTFSSAVSVGIRLNCWKTKPKARSRSSASSPSPSTPRSRPSKRTLPELGRSSAPSSCSSVVLPEPLGPSSATNSPALDLEVDAADAPRSSSAPRWKKRFDAPRRRTAASSLIPPASARRRGEGARRGRRRRRRRAGRRSPRAGSRRSRTPTAIGASSATWSLTRARGAAEAEEAVAPPVLELAVSVGAEGADRGGTRSRARRRAARRAMPWASDSPTTCRTTSHCVQPSALSVPSSRTRLPTEESVRSTASRNAATAARMASAIPSRFERFEASTSEPLIESATCFALATCARG